MAHRAAEASRWLKLAPLWHLVPQDAPQDCPNCIKVASSTMATGLLKGSLRTGQNHSKSNYLQ
eukprot:5651248-Pyramimonas_sp.AAC.1